MDNELVDWVEIYKDEGGEFRWRAKSNNGDVLGVSGEGYENELHAENMAAGMFPGKEIRHEDEKTQAGH